jgi:hypothetical protein
MKLTPSPPSSAKVRNKQSYTSHGALLSMGITSFLYIYCPANLSHFIRFLSVQCVCIPCFLMHTSLQTNKTRSIKNTMSAHIMFSMRKPWGTHGFHYTLLAMSDSAPQKQRIMKISQQLNVVPSEINM